MGYVLLGTLQVILKSCYNEKIKKSKIFTIMIKLFLCYFSANAKILFGKEPPFTSKLMATTDIAAGEVIE